MRAVTASSAEFGALAIISANIHRRHMGKGQRAMAVAIIYPEAEQAHRGKKSEQSRSKIAQLSGTGETYIKQARTILQFAPDIAPNVLSGGMALQDAYNEARRRKRTHQ